MWFYLIIAAEIAILYTVFWYIYIWEPKPFKIQGNPWGNYSGNYGRNYAEDDAESSLTASGVSSPLPFEIDQDDLASPHEDVPKFKGKLSKMMMPSCFFIVREYRPGARVMKDHFMGVSKMENSTHRHHRHGFGTLYNICGNSHGNSHKSHSLISRIFSSFARLLYKLSMRVP